MAPSVEPTVAPTATPVPLPATVVFGTALDENRQVVDPVETFTPMMVLRTRSRAPSRSARPPSARRSPG